MEPVWIFAKPDITPLTRTTDPNIRQAAGNIRASSFLRAVDKIGKRNFKISLHSTFCVEIENNKIKKSLKLHNIGRWILEHKYICIFFIRRDSVSKVCKHWSSYI